MTACRHCKGENLRKSKQGKPLIHCCDDCYRADTNERVQKYKRAKRAEFREANPIQERTAGRTTMNHNRTATESEYLRGRVKHKPGSRVAVTGRTVTRGGVMYKGTVVKCWVSRFYGLIVTVDRDGGGQLRVVGQRVQAIGEPT